MVKNFLIFLSLLSLHLRTTSAKCSLSVDTKAIFIQRFGENHMIFRPETEIFIREGESIEAFCPSGFMDSQSYDLAPYHRKITCNEGHTKGFEYLRSEYDYDAANDYKRHNLNCLDSSPHFYEGVVPNCPKTGFYYGFNINELPVIFAEICFDLDKMDTVFIHYVASERSPILERQEQYNPTKYINASWLAEKASFGAYDTSAKNLEKHLDNVITSNLQNFAEVSKYIVRELVPIKKAAGSLRKFIDGTELPNIIPWWSTLRNVNWKYYEQLLSNRARKYALEIYAGKSGAVSYPTQGKCDVAEVISYEHNSFERPIPKYIWNYIKTPETNSSQDIVVIAVNTPFLPISDQSTLLCEDICDNIEWLKQLNKTRKYPAYGYIFCCRPEDVSKLLDGFPETFLSTSVITEPLDP